MIQHENEQQCTEWTDLDAPPWYDDSDQEAAAQAEWVTMLQSHGFTNSEIDVIIGFYQTPEE